MQVRITTQISIAASRARVFEYLANLKYHHLWNPQVLRISTLEKLSLGSSFDSVSLLLGIKVRSKNVVTKFLPKRELTIENNTGTVHYQANFLLKAEGKKTLVICTTKVSSDSSAFAFAKPVLKMLARRELQTDLQALKIAVEQKLQ